MTFNLSEKQARSLLLAQTIGINEEFWYGQKDVKEFIRLITSDILVKKGEPVEIAIMNRIRKLAGSDLIKTQEVTK